MSATEPATDVLSIWTVYANPNDFPGLHVARRFDIKADGVQITDQVLVTPALEDLRDELRGRGLTPLPRQQADDPKIVESWI